MKQTEKSQLLENSELLLTQVDDIPDADFSSNFQGHIDTHQGRTFIFIHAISRSKLQFKKKKFIAN